MENKIYPFKFLDAYTAEDKDIFFGREEEVEQLYQMIYQSDILLLYGASGTGKTSLIQCGLASQFQQHDWLEAFVRRNKNINESLQKALIALGGERDRADSEDLDWLNNLMGEEDTTITTQALTTTQQYIKNIYLKHFRPIYLIFDQFEELFILGTKAEQAQFIATIQEILKVEQPIKLIFSIREEYLGSLYEFEKVVPELLKKKLRIDPMNLEKVKAVILGATACTKSIVHIQQGEEEAIAEQVFEKIRGEENTLTIQLPYLQVFLDKYYRHISQDRAKVPSKEATFTLAALQEIGDIGNILRDFLDEQIVEISKVQLCDHQTIWKILSPFVTVDGTKEPISLEALNIQLPNIPASLIESVVFSLVNNRILRFTEEEELYEIAHDSLALRIAEKRSDEEINLLEVKNLIKSQSQLKDETRELFSEKQLAFIEPFLGRIVLNEEEQLLLEESRLEVAAQQKIKRRNKLILVVSLIVVFVTIGLFAISSQHQKNMAQEASARNQKILDAMDFYDDKYALAFSNGKYGFIDKEGNNPIPYEYDKGEPFNPETGFAKMGIEGYDEEDKLVYNKYLIDTNHNRYRFINVTEELEYGGKFNTIFSTANVQWIKENLPNDGDRTRLLGDIGNIYQQVMKANSLFFDLLKEEEGNLALNFSGLDKKAVLRILEQLSQEEDIKKRVMLLFLQNTALDSLPSSIRSFTNLKELNLRYTNLDSLPSYIDEFQDLVALDLSHTNIKHIPSTIAQLKRLKRLNVSSTKITVVPDFLRHFYKLTTLDLAYTSIKDVPDFISEIQQLERLDLAGTKISTLPSSLGQLNQLTVLNLGNTLIKELPSSIVELENLKKLSLYKTAIKELPYAFGKLKKLVFLSLDHTLYLESLPESFCQLESLKHLHLNTAGLKSLPTTFGQLKSLTTLYLNDCQLKTLPESFSGLQQLTLLSLNESHALETLPNSFGQLPNLKELYLENAVHLETLPASFGQLKELTILHLIEAPLKKLPNSFSQLKKLQQLDMNFTSLEELPPNFGELTLLTQLNLSGTALQALPASFSELHHLEELELYSTEISSLPASFGELKELYMLDLDFAPLKVLPNSFGQLEQLQVLDLTNTQLEELPSSFGQLKQLKSLSLTGTKITTLPNSIGNLSTLESISLPVTLKKLPKEFFGLNQLRTISSTATALEDANLSQFYLLKYLSLLGEFSHFPTAIFQLPNLTRLHIDQNPILPVMPEGVIFPQLESFSYHLKDNEHYASNKENLEQLKAQLPHVNFIIIDEKNKSKGGLDNFYQGQ